MGTNAKPIRVITVVIVSILVLAAASTAAFAQDTCPTGIDTCLVVNSNLDTNVRDDALTMREAIMVADGDLDAAELTSLEAAQIFGDEIASDTVVGVYFDPDVFCDGCGSNTIVLSPPMLGGPALDSPPMLGGPASYSGELIVATPPLLGGPAVVNSPPMLGGPARLGMGLENGVEVVAPVVVDGSQLTDEYVGMWAFTGVWLRGMEIRNFAGHAIEVEADVADDLLIGSNGDGVNDDAEAVVFSNNGADVVVVGN